MEKKYKIIITSGVSLMIGASLYELYHRVEDPALIVFTVGLILVLSPIFIMLLYDD